MKQLQSPQDRTYSLCGDPCYSPPEMLQGQGKADCRLCTQLTVLLAVTGCNASLTWYRYSDEHDHSYQCDRMENVKSPFNTLFFLLAG